MQPRKSTTSGRCPRDASQTCGSCDACGLTLRASTSYIERARGGVLVHAGSLAHAGSFCRSILLPRIGCDKGSYDKCAGNNNVLSSRHLAYCTRGSRFRGLGSFSPFALPVRVVWGGSRRPSVLMGCRCRSDGSYPGRGLDAGRHLHHRLGLREAGRPPRPRRPWPGSPVGGIGPAGGHPPAAG